MFNELIRTFTNFSDNILLSIIVLINLIANLVLISMNLHRVLYGIIGLFKKAVPKKTEHTQHKITAVISARNEEDVIGNLVDSIWNSDYPKELLKIIVIADNCTDNTAQICRDKNCIVFERFNDQKIGKGYALNYMFTKLHTQKEYAEINTAEAYTIIDADNLVDKNFFKEINKTFDEGYEVVTSYRNIKNYGENWVSATSSLVYLGDSRFLNNPRMTLKTSSAITGTGFLVSKKIIEEYDNWNSFCLVEDVQFSSKLVADNKFIGYNHNAIIYDEQTTSFKQSQHQKERWVKGFYQVIKLEYGKLIKNMFHNFACWDIMTTFMPVILFTVALFVINPLLAIFGAIFGNIEAATYGGITFGSMLAILYCSITLFGNFVVICEWKRIKASPLKKLMYIPLFPFMLAGYFPCVFTAAFKKVKWVPIKHKNKTTFSDIHSETYHTKNKNILNNNITPNNKNNNNQNDKEAS